MPEKRPDRARPEESALGVRLPMPGPGDVPKDVWAIFLAHVRRGRGLSQRELGRRAGVTQQTISKIEAGGICAHDRLKARLAMVLDVPTAELFPWASQLRRAEDGVIAWPSLRGFGARSATDV